MQSFYLLSFGLLLLLPVFWHLSTDLIFICTCCLCSSYSSCIFFSPFRSSLHRSSSQFLELSLAHPVFCKCWLHMLSMFNFDISIYFKFISREILASLDLCDLKKKIPVQENEPHSIEEHETLCLSSLTTIFHFWKCMMFLQKEMFTYVHNSL